MDLADFRLMNFVMRRVFGCWENGRKTIFFSPNRGVLFCFSLTHREIGRSCWTNYNVFCNCRWRFSSDLCPYSLHGFMLSFWSIRRMRSLPKREFDYILTRWIVVLFWISIRAYSAIFVPLMWCWSLLISKERLFSCNWMMRNKKT